MFFQWLNTFGVNGAAKRAIDELIVCGMVPGATGSSKTQKKSSDELRGIHIWIHFKSRDDMGVQVKGGVAALKEFEKSHREGLIAVLAPENQDMEEIKTIILQRILRVL